MGEADVDGGYERVVLVHGLWMHGVVFSLFSRRLGRMGFDAQTYSYPTVRSGLGENASKLHRYIVRSGSRHVHLVGHSLGGLVVLRMLADRDVPWIGRVVLMGAPCDGCHCAGWLAHWPGGDAVLGRSMQDWLRSGGVQSLSKAHEIGVIAGNRSFGTGRLIPGLARPNDGVVAVQETRLDSAQDRLVLPVTHSQMLVSRICVEQTAHFLRTGSFQRDG